jgi:hypothetical protein
MQQRRQHRPNDDAFDERGLLRDGRIYRVPTKLMDGARQRPARVVDAKGGTEGLGRPGYRVPVSDSPLHALAAATKRQSAYDSYERDLVNAWRGKGDAVGESDDEGAICTVQNDDFPDYYGSPGHIRNHNGRLVCVHDDYDGDDDEEEDIADPQSDHRTLDRKMADHKQRMNLEYSNYDKSLKDAWRRG